MKTLLFTLLIILTTTTHAQVQNAKSIAGEQKEKIEVDCSEIRKTKLLIRKGAINKELCMQFKGDQIKLQITGQLFKLASYSNKKVDASLNRLDCQEKIEETDKKEESEPKKLPKEQLSIFSKIITKLVEKIKDYNLQYNSESKLDDKIRVVASGYADGVRVKMKDFDKLIEESLPYNYTSINPSTDSSTEVTFKKEDFKNAVCKASNYENPYRGVNNSIIPNDYISILNPTRNSYLAKTRAEFLANIVLENFSNDLYYPLTYFPRNSENFEIYKDNESCKESCILSYDSPLLTTGQNLCKGYCSHRRGAEIKFIVPGIAKLETVGPIQIGKLPTTVVSLKTTHYNNFLKIIQASYVKDIEEYINSQSSKPTLEFKEVLKKIDIVKAKGRTVIKQKLDLKNSIEDKNDFLEIDWSQKNVSSLKYKVDQKKFDKYAKKLENNSINLEQFKKANISFFKEFFLDYTKITDKKIIEELESNPYFVWNQLFFWNSLRRIIYDEKKDKFYFTFAQNLTDFTSQQNNVVSWGKPSILKETIYKIIENCDQLNVGKKITMSIEDYKASCKTLLDYISDFSSNPSDPNTLLDVQSIYENVTDPGNLSEESNKSIFKKFTRGDLARESIATLDDLVPEDKELKSKIKIDPDPNAAKIFKEVIGDEIYQLKKMDTYSAEFNNTEEAKHEIISLRNDRSNSFEKNILATSTSGQTTTPFNMLNTRMAQLMLLKSYRASYDMTNSGEDVLREISPSELITGIFLNVAKISTHIKTSQGHTVKGFFHDLCHTGVVFDMPNDPTNIKEQEKFTKFRYLSRFNVRDNSYKTETGSFEKYDTTYDKVSLTQPLLQHVVQHPTTYIVPNCKDCNCIKTYVTNDNSTIVANKLKTVKTGGLDQSKEFLASYYNSLEFEKLLKDSIALNFHSNYTYTADPNPETDTIRRIKDQEKIIERLNSKNKQTQTDINNIAKAKEKIKEYLPPVPYKEYSAEFIIKEFEKKGIQLTFSPSNKDKKYLDRNFCIYTPIIPQSHSAGDGKTNGSAGKMQQQEIIQPPLTCPLADVLESKDENNQDVFPDVGLKPEEIDEIYNHCSNITSNFPMSEEDCKNKEKNKICHNFTDEDASKYSAHCSQASMEIGDKTLENETSFCETLLKY